MKLPPFFGKRRRADQSARADALIRQGDEARDRRDWGTAARRYQGALAADPDRAGIWVQFGHALKESGALWRAEEAYRRAIVLEDDHADNFLQLGHVLKLRGDAPGALKAYLEAERIDPTTPDIGREINAMRRFVAERTSSILDWRPGLHPQDEARNPAPKVFFYPDYTPTNFYQTGLYSAFAPEIEVAFGALEDAVEASAQRAVVFHLHWPEPLFAGCRTDEHYSRRVAKFWRLVAILKANGGLLFWTVHNALPHDRTFFTQALAFHRRLAEEADLVHVHSEAAIGVLETLYETRIARPVVLPHGNYLGVYPNEISGPSARGGLGLPEDAFIFGFVGQLRPYKGVETLMEAFEIVRAESDRPVHLLIAGKPVWPTHPGTWAARGEAATDVTVVEGFIDDDELQVFLNAADAVVLPYKDILTSGSAVMAAGFARPVMLPELPTMAEIIAHDVGPGFDPAEVDSLADAMRAMLAADGAQLTAWRANALAFAESADWPSISAKLKTHVPAVETWEELQVRGKTLSMSPGAPVAAGAIGVALLTHRSAEDAREAASALPREIGGRQVAIFVLDNSEDPRELGKLRRTLPGAEILTAHDNLGYAAGNNILMQRMRDVGCEFVLIINPDIRIEAEAIECLLAEAEVGRIVSPVILNAAGAASFTGGKATIGDRVEVGQVAPEGDAPYPVDLLQGSAVMLPLAALDVVGFMEESYFLYFEETDWFLSMKGKAELWVTPGAVAHHRKTSHGQATPTLYYIYYFLRNSLTFNKKFCGDYEGAKAHYTDEFVAGWRSKIERTAPRFLPIYEALVRVAFEDGARGVVGRIDIQARLDEVIGRPGTPGAIEYIEPDAIGGSTLSSFAGDRRVVWVFAGEYPVMSVPANEAGPKANFADGRRRSDFRVDLPVETLVGANAPLTLRESETGARLPISARLCEEVIADDRLTLAHFSALAAVQLRKSEFHASIEDCVQGVIRGWIYDRLYPDRTVYFDLVVDGTVVSHQVANLPHADLSNPKGLNLPQSAHGFEVRIPAELVRGKDKLEVAIHPSGDGEALSRTVACHWSWGNYNPIFSGEQFLSWALLNRTTPGQAYRESDRLQRYFATMLTLERRQAAATDHALTATVVMPVYNREHTVGAAIRSVIAQTWPNWRLIVADDGSIDGSVAVVKRLIEENPDRDIRLLEADCNAGVSAARNRALAAATGDVVAYLDSDNVWKPDYLSIILAALARSPDRRSVYAGSEIWVRDQESGEANLDAIFVNPYSRSALEARNFIDLNVFAHRRDLYEERGGFREDMKRLVDWQLILRYTRGAPPLFLPVLLAEYFIDASANQITATVDFDENYRKILEETDLSAEFEA